MRKFYFVLFLVATTYSLFAQEEKPIEKGNIIIGGDITGGIYTSDIETSDYKDEYTSLVLSMNPSFGLFIIDGLAIGTGIPVNLRNIDSGINSYNSYSIGLRPFIKYYFKFGLFIDVSSEYTLGGYKEKDSDDKRDTNIFSINSGIGYAFFVNSNIAIEPKLNYSYRHRRSISHFGIYENYELDTWDNDLYISIGLQVFL